MFAYLRKRGIAPQVIRSFLNAGLLYPILSIHGIDVIYYGKDLEDYIKNEFGDKNRAELDYKNIEKVPFWTDLM